MRPLHLVNGFSLPQGPLSSARLDKPAGAEKRDVAMHTFSAPIRRAVNQLPAFPLLFSSFSFPGNGSSRKDSQFPQ